MMDQLKVKGESAFKSLNYVTHENIISTEVMSHDTNNNNLLIFLSDRRNLVFNATTVYNEGVSRGIWEEDWAPEGIKSSFTKYLEEKIRNYVKKLIKRTAEQSSEDY